MSKLINKILQSPCGHLNQHLVIQAENKLRAPARPSKHVNWMDWQISIWCTEKGLFYHKELRFHYYRKFRFDFAVTDHPDHKQAKMKIAVEYEGICSEKSGHTTFSGYTKDTDKYNLAQSQGWKVLRFTMMNYMDVLNQIEKNLK